MKFISEICKGAYTIMRLSGIYPPFEITGFNDEVLEEKVIVVQPVEGEKKSKISSLENK